ncbi:MAG: hypothetical protein IT317_24780 [Anaerolineales bacterium]|nr:hypothetical protein [Anaerolineales bacterium]
MNHNGASIGGCNGSNGNGADATATGNGAPPLRWCRVADLARELGRDARRLRELVAQEVPTAQQERRQRPTGGRADLWVTSAAADRLRELVATPAGNGASNAANGAAADATPAGIGGPADAGGVGDLAAAGWRELVADLRGQVATLRSERELAETRREEALRRAEHAEAALGATAGRLAALKAAWCLWYALAARPTWRPWRRLPELPGELADLPALAGG